MKVSFFDDNKETTHEFFGGSIEPTNGLDLVVDGVVVSCFDVQDYCWYFENKDGKWVSSKAMRVIIQ